MNNFYNIWTNKFDARVIFVAKAIVERFRYRILHELREDLELEQEVQAVVEIGLADAEFADAERFLEDMKTFAQECRDDETLSRLEEILKG